MGWPVVRPNFRLLELNARAAAAYHAALPGSPAEEYLESRGLLGGAETFQLGYVSEPFAGHTDVFRGCLSIPYLTPRGVVAFKFRQLRDVDKRARYNSPSGQKAHIFNAQALIHAMDSIVITEGELDAIAATLAGHPAVGLPGANAFKSHFARCFDGIETVFVATDNDQRDDGVNPGQELAKRITESIPQSVRVSLPAGHDVNSTIQDYGAQYFTKLVKSINDGSVPYAS
jgi:DNA primase